MLTMQHRVLEESGPQLRAGLIAHAQWRERMLASMDQATRPHALVSETWESSHAPGQGSVCTIERPVIVRSELVCQAPGAECVGGVTLRLEPAYDAGIRFELTRHAEATGFARAWFARSCESFVEAMGEHDVNALRCEVLEAMTHPMDTRARAFWHAMRAAWQVTDMYVGDFDWNKESE